MKDEDWDGLLCILHSVVENQVELVVECDRRDLMACQIIRFLDVTYIRVHIQRMWLECWKVTSGIVSIQLL